ncbi:protein mono-ADP-ribosyltransferase PARP14-like isoform X2 [Genypterus blacodes]
MLEMYFEKSWTLPLSVSMIPDEQAAIVTFQDAAVVGKIRSRDKHVMCSTSIKVYPYYASLGAALYGRERPRWKLPEPFTESVLHIVWKFLLMKKLLKAINDQMRPYFCTVDLDRAQVKLSPLPSFLRQKDLTAKHIDNWRNEALVGFRQTMSQYIAFECPANAPAWKLVKKDVHSVVKDDVIVELDASSGSLSVAGRAEDIQRVRASVEDIVLKAMSRLNRQTNGISEVMDVSPAMFYILKQEGLQKAVTGISPEMQVRYSDDTKTLSISGLSEEVYRAKSWILERKMGMSRKPLDLNNHLLDFLKKADPMDMSQDLFTSQGISAIYSIEPSGVFLTGISDGALADAASKLKTVLSHQTLDVGDQEVLRVPEWAGLNRQLADTYNSSKKKTMNIQIQQGRITVAGFLNPVKEVSRSLTEFIANHSQVQEAIRVKSCAVVQFIKERKSQDWSKITKVHNVSVDFDTGRPRIVITGARFQVQTAKVYFQELASALVTDNFTADKPGTKKYFLSQGRRLLSTVMKESDCVVVLRPENEEDEEEEMFEEEDGVICYCKVQTSSGVWVSVSKADICTFRVEAVVNAANEELQHIGGLARALLQAAGPQLQTISNEYVARNGKLRPGDAIVTDSCNLPAKYVIHAVGPRYSDFDKKTAVSRLKLAVKESLNQAQKRSCTSVALPAISSGVFGFPVDLCADTIAQAVRQFTDCPAGPGSLTEIHLVDNSENTVRVLARAVNNEFSDLRPTMTVPPPSSARGGASPSGYRGRGDPQFNNKGRVRGGGGRGGRGGRGGGAAAVQPHRRTQSPRGYPQPIGQERAEQRTAEGLRIVLLMGNIQDQTSDVIVNTISEHTDLNKGAVSLAILQAAGPGLQGAVRSAARGARLRMSEVVITDAFNLLCQKVFHAVCPFWDDGAGQAQQELISIIRFCLNTAEKQGMMSLSFPAVGTGNMSFPRDLVSRVLLNEIHAFSHRTSPKFLQVVNIVVHPTDKQTVECFTREFKGQPQRSTTTGVNHEEPANESSINQSQRPSASFGQVRSPTLGVYRMQMGQLTLEVSSGDITKDTSDVIINSSNHQFNLKAGVSKAILDSAGQAVEQECSQIVKAPGYQPSLMIQTSAGLLPSANIIHVVGQNDASKIKDLVYVVLKSCEESKFSSVCFPALGTGQGGAEPSAVADAMVDGVVDFLRKKHPEFVHSVKILIYQKNILMEFHRSMRKRQGQDVEGKGKGVFTKIKDFLFGANEEPAGRLVLQEEEFESAVFDLCADNSKAVSQAKQSIKELIVSEQASRIIKEVFISKLSQEDMDQLKALQRKLTVSIRLEQKQEDQEPHIHLEGLTRDVLTAESAVRELIQKVERSENRKQKASLVSRLVKWQIFHQDGSISPVDMHTNLILEEALTGQESTLIKINDEEYRVDVKLCKATRGTREVDLLREDLSQADIQAHPDDLTTPMVP